MIFCFGFTGHFQFCIVIILYPTIFTLISKARQLFFIRSFRYDIILHLFAHIFQPSSKFHCRHKCKLFALYGYSNKVFKQTQLRFIIFSFQDTLLLL